VARCNCYKRVTTRRGVEGFDGPLALSARVMTLNVAPPCKPRTRNVVVPGARRIHVTPPFSEYSYDTFASPPVSAEGRTAKKNPPTRAERCVMVGAPGTVGVARKVRVVE
jgi:hypothetical protein